MGKSEKDGTLFDKDPSLRFSDTGAVEKIFGDIITSLKAAGGYASKIGKIGKSSGHPNLFGSSVNNTEIKAFEKAVSSLADEVKECHVSLTKIKTAPGYKDSEDPGQVGN